MKIEFDYHSTKYDEDISLEITPSVSLYIYKGFSHNSYTISFAWLIFCFSMDIIINK